MDNERTALFLEVVSFFLVTTDLYGEARLKRLSDALPEKLRSITMWALDIPSWFYKSMKIEKGSALPFIFLGCIVFLDSYYLWDVTANHFHATIIHFLVNILIIVLLIPILPVVFLLLGYLVIAFLVAIIVGLAFTVANLRLSGWMLAVGSILFLASKTITFLHLK